MKYLKSINELFDSEDLKNQYEIPYLQGNLASSYDKMLSDEILRFNTIIRTFPIFNLFINKNADKNHFTHYVESIYLFCLQNEKYRINLAIDLLEKDYYIINMCIFEYPKNASVLTKDNIIKESGSKGSFESLSSFINDEYLPTIKSFGFNKEVDFNKSSNLSYQN